MHCVYLYSYLKQNTTTKNKANEQNQKKAKKTPTSQKKWPSFSGSWFQFTF